MTDNPGFILDRDAQNIKDLFDRASEAIILANKPKYVWVDNNGWYTRGYWAFGGLLVQWIYGQSPKRATEAFFLKDFESLNYALTVGSNYDPGPDATAYARASRVSSRSVKVSQSYGLYYETVSKQLSVIAVGKDPEFTGFK